MKAIQAALLVIGLAAATAQADDVPVVAAFPLSGEEAVAEHLPILDQRLRAEVRKSSAHALLTQEKLSENLLMGPGESLSFCSGEAGCIADMGGEAGATWILYGDLKWSFDRSKLLIHLVLIDVSERSQAAETFGQVPPEKASDRIAGLAREILGIPEPIPAPPVRVALPPTKPEKDPVAVKDPPPGDAPKTARKTSPGAITAQAAPGPPSIWDNPWTWTAAGVGLASLAAASALGALSQQREDDARRLAVTDHPAAQQKLTQAQDYALGANVLFGIGGAGLATAIVLLVLDATAEPEQVQAGVACGPDGCGANLTFKF